MSPNTAAGVRLIRLYQSVVRVYPEKEFRNGMSALMRDGQVVVIAKKITVLQSDGKENRHAPVRLTVLMSLPEKLASGQYASWWADKKNIVTNNEKGRENHYYDIYLYIRADGLPKTVTSILKRRLVPTSTDHAALPR